MNLSEFLAFAATRRPLDTEEIGRFMDEMSDSARRITFELNGSYHTPDEVRALLSRLFGYEIDPSVSGQCKLTRSAFCSSSSSET